MQIDLKVAQLLSSRICHDLAGPIGAVNTGLELMEEDPDNDGAAIKLMARSAVEANRRLAFYRAAFGLGVATSAAAGWQPALDEARILAEGFLESGKVRLDWQDISADAISPALPGAVKVVLNIILMASESLPRGGIVELSFVNLDEGLGVGLTASGEGGALREDLRDALAEDAGTAEDVLSARNVHAYLAQCLARDLGALIEHSKGSNGEIQLAVLFPNASG